MATDKREESFKDLDVWLPEKMYLEMQEAAEGCGMSIEDFIAKCYTVGLKEFFELLKENPEEAARLFQEFENQYQVEFHIN